jgi:tRNA U55 pseudouridine synthase TruB
MSMYGAIQISKEKDRHRAEVAASGDATKIEAYAAAESKEVGAMARLGGSLLTGDLVGGVKAVKDMWDASCEQDEIRRGS